MTAVNPADPEDTWYMPPTQVRVTTPKCPVCHKRSMLLLSKHEYSLLMRNDQSIQTAFPSWSASRRALLVTGTHPNCWEFSEEDVDDTSD